MDKKQALAMTKLKDKSSDKTAAMAVETVPVDSLHLDPANVRKHDERNIDSIRASLSRFGQQHPIIVSPEGVVIAGNGRLQAMRSLGWKECRVVRTDLKGPEAVAFAIADNRTAELAEWDDDALAQTLAALQNDESIDHLAAGFTDDEIQKIIDESLGSPEVVEDEIPEPPADPITKPSDLWRLGEHRLLCGDSTKAEDVERVMGGEKAAAVMSDPPYGVDYVGKTKDALVVHNDGADGLADLLDRSLGNAFEHCLPGGAWYIAAPPGPPFADFATALGSRGIWRQTIVWVKDSMVLGRSDYHYRHEAVFYGWKPGAAHKELPDRKQTTVWEIPRPKASREHPTMKPVAIYERMINNSTSVGSLILDPFLGSGTTLIAAEQLGRKCYGIEISPAYCDVIVERWEKLTGKKAERDAQ